MEYKTLIQRLENLEYDLFEDESKFPVVLHTLYLKNNSKAIKKLTESFARYLFKAHKDYFKEEGYTEAFLLAMDNLDFLSERADGINSLKTFKKDVGPIQDFYRDSINYFQKGTFLNSS